MHLLQNLILIAFVFNEFTGGVSIVRANEPWTKYILSPSSRSIKPQKIYRTTGNVLDVTSNRQSPTDTFRLTGPNATVTYDFGKQTAGFPTIKIGSVNCPLCTTALLPAFTCTAVCQGLGIAYSEWATTVGPESDHQTIFNHTDGTLFVPVNSGQTYDVPTKYARGSFRYLTLSTSPSASPLFDIEVSLSQVRFLAAPKLSDNQLQEYTGHFYSSDDLLNKIWYAGAYTNQLCTISANSSVNHLNAALPSGWSNDATATGLTGADELLVDGAKRDRNPWAGDVEVFLRSVLVTSNYDNLQSTRNVLRECIILQDDQSKFFPYAGSPLGDVLKTFGPAIGILPYNSDTYHLWTIANFADYVLTTADIAFGQQYYGQILTGLQATYQYIDTDNLYNGTKPNDWGRINQGGKNSALNSIYYHTLLQTAKVARYLSTSNAATASDLESRAAKTKIAINAQLLDNKTGLYYENTTSAGHTFYPTDGNTFAVNFNVTQSASQNLQIANALASRLTQFGSVVPELPGGISPYIGSQQIRAQFKATPSDASRAMKLIRTQWGYMLKAFGPSTLIEGYAADGSQNYPFYPGDPGFVSAAHAWSTGPSYSLLANLVGIRASPFDVETVEGDWAFQPHVRGASVLFAQGGYKTLSGSFEATWKIGSGGCSISATLNTPKNTKGSIYVPAFGKSGLTVKLNGKATPSKLIDDYYIIRNVAGGSYSIST